MFAYYLPLCVHYIIITTPTYLSLLSNWRFDSSCWYYQWRYHYYYIDVNVIASTLTVSLVRMWIIFCKMWIVFPGIRKLVHIPQVCKI